MRSEKNPFWNSVQRSFLQGRHCCFGVDGKRAMRTHRTSEKEKEREREGREGTRKEKYRGTPKRKAVSHEERRIVITW